MGLRLDVYSHGIAVSGIEGPEDREVLLQFCRPLVQFQLERSAGRMVKVPFKTFAGALKDRSEFRFHVNQLGDLLQFLGNRGYRDEKLVVTKHKPNLEDYPAVEHIINQMFDPRDYQVPILEYVIAPGTSKMITLQTGKGKTYLALRATWMLGLRTIFIFKGGYVDRWLGDLQKTFVFEDDELLMVRGSGGLIRLMDDALDGTLRAKCIIVTNRTMYDYLKDHENTAGNSELYPIPADQFYQTVGIGFRVIDEVHQEFHLNYRQDLYTHTLKSLSLSATLNSNDRFMNTMYDIAYPVQLRNDGGGYHAYINAVALMYRLSMPKIYRFKGGTGGYSHNAFEKSMSSKKDFFPRYLRIFEYVVRVKFADVMESGQKMLIFCASIELCAVVQDLLQKAFPQFKVGKYTQEDDYSVLEQSDITVSTVLSAGTAVDIPNLRVTFMSTSINSRQSNEQALGRTRELKDFPGVTPEFIYLVAENVEKQLEYHRNKMDYFKGKVLSHKELMLPFEV